ncbi:MAG: saccharopine dehydrogenase C-terminal domain-containing protein [Rubricoccaceae bacterium]
MKITVLGAGAIGSAVAYDLCRRDEVSRVQVCEARPGTLRAFRHAWTHPKLRTYLADARDTQTLEPILAGSACIVSCVAPELNGVLARLAVEMGAHFVDLGSPDAIREEEESLAALAERRQRWVVTGCGLAPGLAGVLVLRGIKALDQAYAAHVRVGDVPTDSLEPFNYRLAHAAEKLIEDYTHPVPVLRNGKVEVRAPMTGIETVDVEGFGEMEAFYAGNGLSAITRALEGRLDRLDAKTLRYPGHASQMRFLLDLGLADTTSIDVRTHLTYRDILIRRMRKRLGGAYRDAVVVRVEVEGRKDGEDGCLVYELVDHFDDESGLSAMQRCTGFPAAAAAVLLGGRHVPGGGVGSAEEVLPFGPFFERMDANGLAVQERWEVAESA